MRIDRSIFLMRTLPHHLILRSKRRRLLFGDDGQFDITAILHVSLLSRGGAFA